MLTPSFFMVRIASTICSTIFGDNPSEGSSSSTSDGFPIKVRAIVSICCSPPLIRHIAEPAAHDRMGRLIRNIVALEQDAAGALLDQTDDRTKGRGFAGAITPEQRHDLAIVDLECDVEQDVS